MKNKVIIYHFLKIFNFLEPDFYTIIFFYCDSQLKFNHQLLNFCSKLVGTDGTCDQLAFLAHSDFDGNWKEVRLELGNQSHVL